VSQPVEPHSVKLTIGRIEDATDRLLASASALSDVQIGEPKTLTAREKTWTFYALNGGFSVIGKDDSYDTPVAEWVYALDNEPVPASRPTIHNWLGHYVIFLPNNYVIQSAPPPNSPLRGPKPGSFLVPEADLAAIWPRITTQTRVYIF